MSENRWLNGITQHPEKQEPFKNQGVENSEGENAPAQVKCRDLPQGDVLLELASKSRKVFSQLQAEKEEQLSRKRTVSEDTEAKEQEDLEYRKYDRYSDSVQCGKGWNQMVAASGANR